MNMIISQTFLAQFDSLFQRWIFPLKIISLHLGSSYVSTFLLFILHSLWDNKCKRVFGMFVNILVWQIHVKLWRLISSDQNVTWGIATHKPSRKQATWQHPAHEIIWKLCWNKKNLIKGLLEVAFRGFTFFCQEHWSLYMHYSVWHAWISH